MSQKKVDAYKSRKLHRGKADKKEKFLFTLEMFAWAFICVVIVGWIGYSAYVKVAGVQENVVQNTVMDTTALDNYVSGLTAADTEDVDDTEADDDDEAEVSETEEVTDEEAEETTDAETADAADEEAEVSDTETDAADAE